jgi:transcriptional regulator with XRE-family HTH domain
MPNMDSVKLGLLLKELRVEAGLTQEGLAEKMEVAQTYVSQVERGVSVASWKYLVGFANTVGTSAITLLRQAGLLNEAAVPYEQEIAELIAGAPAWKDLFSLARENPGIASEMLAFARYLLGKEGAATRERER